jgi:hypothetical protein
MSPVVPLSRAGRWQQRGQRAAAASVRAYHAYAGWLVGLSWRRFLAYALLLMVAVAIVHDMPLFTWKVVVQDDDAPARAAGASKAPAAGSGSGAPPIRIDGPKPGDVAIGVQIDVGKDGIRVTPRPASQAASAADAAATAAAAAASRAAAAAASAADSIRGVAPATAAGGALGDAAAQVRSDLEAAFREARQDAEQAARDAQDAAREAEEARRDAAAALAALAELAGPPPAPWPRVFDGGPGPHMMQLALLWILGSALLKYTYKGRMQAERQAAQAAETAEAESLRRQVVEARMAAMQAQVEPHFLFNTLASIDHLIETDPRRASQMQKNLIALLRASMPTMREASGGAANGVRDLGREIAVIRPYLEILKVRMEERLVTRIDVPDGLLSAEFPPMMIQTLVENAIKHGLEPKAEGGELLVKAEIVHGKLQVTVADTGLGFGRAATAGTGVGLANIRERLQLLYGGKAALAVTENEPSGTRVAVTVPYKTVEEAIA